MASKWLIDFDRWAGFLCNFTFNLAHENRFESWKFEKNIQFKQLFVSSWFQIQFKGENLISKALKI